MRIRSCLKPGQKGTKKWCDRFGENLVSVRYRYDPEKKRRFTTVEIVVEEHEWQPSGSRDAHSRKKSDLLGIQVAGYELELRDKVKKAGAIWRPRQKLWELSYGQILALGLEDRIVDF